jgi:RNA polymerase sigma-70 factor (ECF subfamily)
MTDDTALAQAQADEQALVERLRAGDAGAFETLVRTQMPRMLAVARRMLPTDEDARDAVQDAFLNAYRSIGRFEGQARLSTWLHRIVVNAALMKLRTRRRKPEEPLELREPAFAPDGHHAARYATWDEDVEELAGREQTRQLVRDAILALPGNYRDVVILRDIQELSTDEAAGALGITPNAVKIRLHRARQALRDVLDAHFRRGDS